MILTRLTRWALRAAARRWPADLREDLHREWLAELSHLEQQPGRAGARLGYAVSLLTSPPARDAAGVPRGWAEARSGISPAAALMLAALLGIGVVRAVRSLAQLGFEAAGWETPMWWHLHGAVVVNAAILTLWCGPLAWWLGRRLPMARDGRSGVAGPALLAPLAVVPALLVGDVGEGPLIPHLTTGIGVVAWVVLTALTGAAAARSRRPAAIALVLAGVPAVAAAATALATVPVLISQGGEAARASLLMSFGTEALRPDDTGSIVYTGGLAGTFLAYGWLAVLYGRRAATAPERPLRYDGAPATGPVGERSPSASGAGSSVAGEGPAFVAGPGSGSSPLGAGAGGGGSPLGGGRPLFGGGRPLFGGGRPRLGGEEPPHAAGRPMFPFPVLIAGVVATLAGVLSWAYTVTYLTPAMPVMSAAAPMPGGDGEIYLWVAELRWAAALFTALGMLVATADRRSAFRAAAVVAAGLLATESVLLNHEVTGLSGLRIALLAAAAVIGLGWTLAGRVAESVTRTRTTAAAIAAAGLGPILFGQGTPPENHPFMPLGLPLTTVVVAAGMVLLGVVTAVATGAHRLHPIGAVLLVALPPAAVAGFGVFLGNGATDGTSGFGLVLSVPFAVLVTAVLRRHRPRRHGRTALTWALLTVAGLPASVVLVIAAMMPLSFAADLLFAVDGTGYPADGISMLPGAALILLPAAVLLAARPGDAPETGTAPAPGPQPQPAATVVTETHG
ncbi:hypothetical protein [Actinoplanes sp. CA-252034]|uniref:hypothetical protein n=1 Tax=Actinoplanes sp. CA-252034 TaxID=3239906 RepID=UPI003D95D46A